MKKGKTLTRQVLAWILSLTMVMSMAPVSVYAEENAENTGCSHIHDENCGGLAQEEPDETEAEISEELPVNTTFDVRTSPVAAKLTVVKL